MMTVKKLIDELQKIENKFLEVYVLKNDNEDYHLELLRINKVNNKILIFTK